MNLEQLPVGAIDQLSIEEVSNFRLQTDEAKAVQRQVLVADFTSMTFNRIRWEGAEYMPGPVKH
jgi:hypothetical protein